MDVSSRGAHVIYWITGWMVSGDGLGDTKKIDISWAFQESNFGRRAPENKK
jgi:hypothetical protein